LLATPETDMARSEKAHRTYSAVVGVLAAGRAAVSPDLKPRMAMLGLSSAEVA
jgi:hypothetical protein